LRKTAEQLPTEKLKFQNKKTMKTKQTMYALFMGIDKYPIRSLRLGGCINDITAMHDHLKGYASDNNIDFQPKCLKNHEVSRAGIINAFSHFEAAKDGDICVLHYAGHGARVSAPIEFRHLESDKMMASIVCHDSNRDGHKDLLDKELAWLIWKATKDKKNITFVSIMDCCHSGEITRSGKELEHEITDEILVREAPKRTIARKIETLLGFEDYIQESKNRWNVPLARHVLLAAATDKQKAKEISTSIGGRHGIFTYCLLHVLKLTKKPLAYVDLIADVKNYVKNHATNQSPQILPNHFEDKDLYFLTNKSKPSGKIYAARWNKRENHWYIDAGKINGILEGLEADSYTHLTLPTSDLV